MITRSVTQKLGSRLGLLGQAIVRAVLGLALLEQFLLGQQPQIIPQPRELQTNVKKFQITSDLTIVLLSSRDNRDRYALKRLEDELEMVTHRKFSVTSSRPASPAPAILLGRIEQSPMTDFLRIRGISTDGIGSQGYVLDVGTKDILVAGRDSSGLFYGVQTLCQLLVGSSQDATILGARIRDWPALPFRGTQVDLARGPVPNPSYMKRIVRTISEFKVNQLYINMEDSFRLEGHPLIGLLSDTLSREDWKELISYAAWHHVDIIPVQNSCGQLHKVLRFENYSDLGESPHGHVLAPDRESYSFLKDLFSQLAEVFPTSFYHIGCDETFERGRGKSAAQVQKEGWGSVYMKNLLQIYDLVRAYNKQVVFWGDMMLDFPDLIKLLPKDLIVATWEYGPHPSFERWLKPYAAAGMKFIVCPWVGNTWVMVPDYESAAANIGVFLNEGKKVGAIGMNNTVWNDVGETLYGLNWWSIVYGAACAWEPGETSVREFDQKFDWSFYRNIDHRFVEAIKELGHINEVLRGVGVGAAFMKDFGGTDNNVFWRDPFSPNGQEELKKALPVASKIRLMAEDAYVVFAESSNRALKNVDSLANLRFAALRLDALGMRYEFIQHIAEHYASALAHEKDTNKQVASNLLIVLYMGNSRLEDLRDYTTKLRELYEELWMSENYPKWLPNILQLYDGQARLWHDKMQQFKEIHLDFEKGKPLPSAESLGLISVPPTR